LLGAKRLARAELALNHRLASDVYKAVAPIRRSPRGLTVGNAGDGVDWLVVMRRLDWRQTLECALENGRPATGQLDRLVSTRVQFYRQASAIVVSGGPPAWLATRPRLQPQRCSVRVLACRPDW
jgi:uncharacterized protein